MRSLVTSSRPLMVRCRAGNVTNTAFLTVPGLHCNMTLFLRHVAVQTRDRQKGGVCYVPGSAAHHERARRRHQTSHTAMRPGPNTDSHIPGHALIVTYSGTAPP